MDDIQFTHIKNVIIFSENVNHLFDCNFFKLSNPLMTNLFVNSLFMWLRRINIDANTLWNTFTLKKWSSNVYYKNSLCLMMIPWFVFIFNDNTHFCAFTCKYNVFMGSVIVFSVLLGYLFPKFSLDSFIQIIWWCHI